jgi:hypothetical protein
MDGELQAAADIATGAVIAKAVEPDNGSSAAATNDDSCLNCGATITGSFCGTCGQKRKVHRTLSAFGHDIAHSVLHFDGKIWRTLPLLVWRPGDLTRRYIHGERAKFVSPLALFLFTVFLTFALFNFMVPAGSGPDVTTDMANDAQFNGVKAEMAQEIEQLKAQLAKARQTNQPTDDIQAKLDDAQLTMRVIGTTQSAITGDKPGDGGWRFTDLDFPGADRLNAAVKQGSENPQLLLYKVQSNAYKFSWALIPISVPFVWLLFFWRRQFKMFDHAVFVTYSLCFMMVGLSIAAALINGETYEVAGGLLLAFAPPIHMYRQLRQAYGLTRLGAFIRMLLLLSFAGVALILFGLMIIALGVTG